MHAVTALSTSVALSTALIYSTNCVITVDECTCKHWCAALNISLTFKLVYRCLSLWGCVCRQCPWRSEEYSRPLPLELQEPGVGPGKGTLVKEQ